MAREHWQLHLPRRRAELEDPDRFFDLLEDEAAAQYAAIRDGLLAGLNPTDPPRLPACPRAGVRCPVYGIGRTVRR